MLHNKQKSHDELFAGLEPPRKPMTTEDQAREDALAAYEERFGYLPFGIGVPMPTNEQLWEAVNTGQEITESIPEGAEA